jgi:hypothetical protein
MAPDFEYFSRGEQVSRISHTFLGIAVWGVPVTLALAVAFHHLVKWPVLLALPRRIAPVFAAPWSFLGAGPMHVVSLVVSAALGNLTHLVWDGATHSDGMIASNVAALREFHGVPMLGRMALHRILQHGSTVVGLAILAWAFVRAVRRHPPPPPMDDVPRVRAWIALGACIAVGVAAMSVRLRAIHISDPGSTITGIISGVLAGTIVASVIVRRDGMRYRDAVSA